MDASGNPIEESKGPARQAAAASNQPGGVAGKEEIKQEQI